MPEFERVCEEVERGSISLGEAGERASAIRDPVAHHRLLRLQIANAFFIRGDDGVVAGIDDPVEQRFDLPVDQLHVGFERAALRASARELRIPEIAEEGEGGIEQPLCRTEALQDDFELAFQPLFPDRFAGLGASTRVAEIITVVSAAPLRPAGGERLAAPVAGDERRQREVVADVLTRRNLRHAVAAILHRLPCGKADERFVLARNEVDAPVGITDVTGINGPVEHLVDPFDMHLIVAVARKGGLRVQKPLHLSHRLEASRGETIEGFGDQRGYRLVAHQQLAVTGDFLIPIADRLSRDPIAAHSPRAHLLSGLACILFAVEFSLRRQHRFDKFPLGRIFEIEVQAFYPGIALLERCPKLEVEFRVARKAFEVVEDDDVSAVFLRIQIAKQRQHTGPLHEIAAAGHIVRENGLDLISVYCGVLPTTQFLRIETMTFDCLILS